MQGNTNHAINGMENLRDLALLFVKGQHRYRYEGGFMPLGFINIFPQPRKTFEHIHEMSLDLAQKGILNPPTVAHFDKEGCAEYLSILNRIWKTEFTINDAKTFSNNGATVYATLIAGERRVRGWLHTWPKERENCSQCKELWEKGCQVCLEEFGQEPPGTCYKRHFGNQPVEETEVRFCIDITPLEAFFLQLSENTHMTVPPYEEARAYAQFYKVLKEADERFSVPRFASMVGRSADTVKNAIRFCELPGSIQSAVERKTVPYGIAIELTRLQAKGLSEKELDWWLLESVTKNFKVSDFNKTVTEFLKNLDSEQTSLFEIFGEEQQKELKKHHFRMIVEKEYIRAIWSYIYYFNRVSQLFEEGKLGKPDSPFSERSPRKVFRKLVNEVLAQRVLPHLKSLLPKGEGDKAKEILEDTDKILSVLENSLPD